MRRVLVCASAWVLLAGTEARPDSQYNLALSARVTASDPERTNGTRAGRLDEFPAEDLFLTSELPANPDGTYTPPADKSGKVCIGLDWAERRILTEVWIEMSGPEPEQGGQDARPPASEVVAQYWGNIGSKDDWTNIGQTFWQGKWETFPGKVERAGNRLSVRIDPRTIPPMKDGWGVFRVRWILPSGSGTPVIKELGASSPSTWTRGTFRVQWDPSRLTAPPTVQAYNGRLYDESGEPRTSVVCEQNDPAVLDVLYCSTNTSKADRTSLRFTTSQGMFTVGIPDVLNTEGVYVADCGLLVTRGDSPLSLEDYRRKIAGRKTILQRVREMPDQTFEQAMKTIWRPVQNNGPTLVSLAADNRKFIVHRTGEVVFKTTEDVLRVTPRFGGSSAERMDWGSAGLNTAVVPPDGRKPLPLNIKDKTYERGVGVHANASLTVQLDGAYNTFEAEVGMQMQGNDRGEVTFQVLIDGEKRYDSGPMRQSDPARPVKVAVTGAREITLLAATGPNIDSAAGNWAEARLVSKDGKTRYLADLLASSRKTLSSFTRCLDGGWLPIPKHTIEDAGVRYTQRTFVASLDDAAAQAEFRTERPLCVIELTAENTSDEPRRAFLDVSAVQAATKAKIEAQPTPAGTILRSGERLWASVDLRDKGALEPMIGAGGVQLRGELPAKARSRCVVYVPGWEASPGEAGKWKNANELRADVEAYWKRMLSRSMQVETPEPLLNDFIRSTQIQCLMAARSRKDPQDGRTLIEPWIAADAYGPLESEGQAVILGMDLFGHHDFARRCHEFFISSYKPTGLLTTGYTMMGTGQHLWTLARHCVLTHDTAWLEQHAPQIVNCCDWIIRQIQKTKRRGPDDEKLPEWGFAPPGVLADWNRYAYYFYINGHYCAGLKDMAEALSLIRHPRAAEIARTAAEYREDLLRAYEWNQSRAPVVALRDGTWVPPIGSSLYTWGESRDFYGGVGATACDAEAGGNHLISFGLMEASSRPADWAIDCLEDRWFLIDGIFVDYRAADNEKDWFDYGGFAKLQPHYTRATELHAARDDVKPFVRSYFNHFPVLLNKENLTYWEHLHNGGAWNKTHESAWFLEMTHTMLVYESNDALCFAPFVTDNWLTAGKRVVVRNVPTRFGPVSYEMKGADGQTVEARIEPPTRGRLRTLLLRVRLPEGKAIRSVTVNGKEWERFDRRREWVVLPGDTQGVQEVVVRY